MEIIGVRETSALSWRTSCYTYFRIILFIDGTIVGIECNATKLLSGRPVARNGIDKEER